MLKINQLMLLPKEDSGLHNLLVRIHGTHINSTFQRRESVVICNPANGFKIIRYAVGGGSMTGLTKDSLAIDYDGLETLGFKMNKVQPCDLIIRKARPLKRIYSWLNTQI